MKTLIRVSIFLILSFAAFEANAFCVFSVGDGHLICTTCSCAELAAAGVSMTGCVDVLAMASSPGGGMPVVKIVRYSDTKVVLVTKDGKEYPLASDESQKQFENLMKRDGWQKLMSSFLLMRSIRKAKVMLSRCARRLPLSPRRPSECFRPSPSC